jgi:hypothetical protein
VAKINELTDSQLEKALLQYKDAFKKDPNDKVKAILHQLQLERQKRQVTQNIDQDADALSQLSRSAEASVIKQAIPKSKPKSKGIQFQSRINTGAGVKLDTKWTNLMLAGGCVSGVVGLFLFMDAFLTHWLPEFTLMTTLASFLIVLGLALTKAASYLSDDNT